MSQVEKKSTKSDGGEKEGFDLETYLRQYDFTSYHKIAEPIAKGDLSLKDLLDCTESDLKDICKEYGIKTVQRNRLINGIKKLPNSKANDAKSNDKSSHTFVLLTTQEQQNIDTLAKMSTSMKERINEIKKACDISDKSAEKSKSEIAALFIQVRERMNNLEKRVMKQVESNVLYFVVLSFFVFWFLILANGTGMFVFICHTITIQVDW